MLAREAVAAVPGDPQGVRILAKILWLAEKDKEAAETLARLAEMTRPDYVCEALSDDFVRIYALLPPERLSHALAALGQQRTLGRHYDCPAIGFSKAGRWGEAVQVASELRVPGTDDAESLVTRYEYRKKWKGPGEAAEWLKKQIPAGQMNRVGMRALIMKDDDALWDAVQPEPANQPHLVWMSRAASFALRGGSDAHRVALLDYYRKDDPEPFHAGGRCLLGLIDEPEFLATVHTAWDLSFAGYFLGARAQGEQRYRDACDWYRVSIETQQESAPRSFALWALSDWVQTAQGLWKLETLKTH